MTYEGDILEHCYEDLFDFSNTSAVIVSGDWPNQFGHMLLCTGLGEKRIYAQVVAAIYARPRYMTQAGYVRYLLELHKHEIRRMPVVIKDQSAALLALERALSQPRTWWAVVHNCESFVEDIVVAGGGPKLHTGVFTLPTRSHINRDKIRSGDRHSNPFEW